MKKNRSFIDNVLLSAELSFSIFIIADLFSKHNPISVLALFFIGTAILINLIRE